MKEQHYIQKPLIYTDTTAALIGQLPPNAYVTQIRALVTTAFNSGGADVVDVGISGTAAHFANDIDVSSTGSASVTLTAQAGVVQSDSDSTEVYATYIPAATAASTGAAKIVVEYAFNE